MKSTKYSLGIVKHKQELAVREFGEDVYREYVQLSDERKGEVALKLRKLSDQLGARDMAELRKHTVQPTLNQLLRMNDRATQEIPSKSEASLKRPYDGFTKRDLSDHE